MRVRSVCAVLLLSITTFLARGAPPESLASGSPPIFSSRITPSPGEADFSSTTSPRFDVGSTIDDFGSVASCASLDALSSQYVLTKSIVFGSAVEFPGGPTPAVVAVADGACLSTCRSTGSPPFAGDWWCQLAIGSAPGIPAYPAGVNSFFAELCWIDDPDNPGPLVTAYDIDGNVIDTATPLPGSGVQYLSVEDPLQEKRISFVRVLSSMDLAGLTIDLLDYDDPEPITGIETTPALRDYLGDCYPNPCRGLATIGYGVTHSAHVHLGVYNTKGQLVRTLVDEQSADHAFGRSVVWDGRDNEGEMVSSGVYFYRMVADRFSETKKLVLIK